MKKTDWDELDDVDDLLKSDLLVNQTSDVPVVLDQPIPNSKAKQINIVEKPRRRSALIDDNAVGAEVRAVGYGSRNQRLSEQNQPLGSIKLTEENKGEFNRLLAKGVYLLGMREHSVKEMMDKLTARSDFVDVVLAVVDELLENNYLSNERFAESYVRSRRNKGFGPVKIRVELKNKGVSNQLVTEYLQAESPEWIDVARDQYEKKYRDRVENYKEWTKRARFMQSRGFTMEHIQAVLPSADFY